MRFPLLLIALTIAAAAAMSAPAAAGTKQDTQAVIEQIGWMKLSPTMLFPRSLPPKLRRSKVTFDADLVQVMWDRGTSGDRRLGYITLSRAPKSRLADDLETVHARGDNPVRVKVGSRHVWKLCGHVCGYEWIQDAQAYGVFGIYYWDDPRGLRVAHDQRTIIRRLHHLPR